MTDLQARTLARLIAIQKQMESLANEARSIDCHGEVTADYTIPARAGTALGEVITGIQPLVYAMGVLLDGAKAHYGANAASMLGLPHPLPCDDTQCQVCERYAHPEFANKAEAVELAAAI
jgi:hypothetical protein